MKKLSFILSGIVLLTIGSCQKEEIKPKQYDDSYQRNVIIEDCGNNKSNGNDVILGKGIIADTLINITDPNGDEDDERRVKKK
ncbi:hypothetical protein [Brumimicrobium oceani]|uniref:Uncharacterized protein n=1 Tax=Brumimicrobium oceani TaxID=2100725 RepID=A0A2U2XCC0_9FLAO|nr:hypothetical protein [Brumimicrobium oceani]PWH85449.1 hypothetical protein DIT68_09330 [Brumimicrobium oceani]